MLILKDSHFFQIYGFLIRSISIKNFTALLNHINTQLDGHEKILIQDKC